MRWKNEHVRGKVPLRSRSDRVEGSKAFLEKRIELGVGFVLNQYFTILSDVRFFADGSPERKLSGSAAQNDKL